MKFICINAPVNPWSGEVDKTYLIIYFSSWIAGLFISFASLERDILNTFIPVFSLFINNYQNFKILIFILAMLSIVLTIARKVLKIIRSGFIMIAIACHGFVSGYLIILRWELGIVFFFIGLLFILQDELISRALYSGR